MLKTKSIEPRRDEAFERFLVGLDVDAGVPVRFDRVMDRGDRGRLVELRLCLSCTSTPAPA
jgi:hypothetical protein